MTILINPKSSNPHSTKAIEPPIWCALMAKDGDRIVDFEISMGVNVFPSDDILIVVMGSNPSASSTPKMPEVYALKSVFTKAKITGLHPMATGEADVDIPPPEELVKIKRAKWELLPMGRYRAHNWHCLHDIDNRDKYVALYTSYGCPYGCDFCNIHTIYKTRNVYFRPPEDVASEIDYLVKNYGIKNLKFCDELFTLNHRHVSHICKLIREYKLNIWAYARVGNVTPELLREMKEAGINWLAYGFESGNKDVLKGVSKKYGDIFETVEMTREAGINIMGNFIFGLPDDTFETMDETMKLAQDLKCEYVNFYCAMDYPGSKLYKGGRDWSNYNQYSGVPSGSKYISPEQVLNYRNQAFVRYFSDESYLRMIRDKFGDKARSHIEAMI